MSKPKNFVRRKEYESDQFVCEGPTIGTFWATTDILQCAFLRDAYNGTLTSKSTDDKPSKEAVTDELKTSFDTYNDIVNKDNGDWVYLLVSRDIVLHDYVKKFSTDNNDFYKEGVGYILGDEALAFMRGLYFDKIEKSTANPKKLETEYQIVGKYPGSIAKNGTWTGKIANDSKELTVADLTTKDIDENPCTKLTNLRLQSYWARVLLQLYKGRPKTDMLYPHLPDQMFRPFTGEGNTDMFKDPLFDSIKNDCAFQNKAQFIKEMYKERANDYLGKKEKEMRETLKEGERDENDAGDKGDIWFEDFTDIQKINKLTLKNIHLTPAGKEELGFRRRRAILRRESLKCPSHFDKEECNADGFCRFDNKNQVCIPQYSSIAESDYEKFQEELKEHEDEYAEKFEKLNKQNNLNSEQKKIKRDRLQKLKAKDYNKMLFKYTSEEANVLAMEALRNSSTNLYKVTQKAVDALDARCHMVGTCAIPQTEGSNYRQKGFPFTNPFFQDKGNPFVPICCKRSLKLDLKRAIMYDRFTKALNVMTPTEAKIELANTTLPEDMKKKFIQQTKKDNAYLRKFSAEYSQQSTTEVGFDIAVDTSKIYLEQLEEAFGLTLSSVAEEQEDENKEKDAYEEFMFMKDRDKSIEDELRNLATEYEKIEKNEKSYWDKAAEVGWTAAKEAGWWSIKTLWHVFGRVLKLTFRVLRWFVSKGLQFVSWIFRNASTVLLILQFALMLKKKLCAFISRTIFGDSKQISVNVFQYTTEMMGTAWSNIVEFGPSFSLIALDSFMKFVPNLINGVASSIENSVALALSGTIYLAPVGVALKGSGIITKSVGAATPFFVNAADSYLQTKLLQQCLTDFQALLTMDDCIITPEPVKVLRGSETIKDVINATITGTKNLYSQGGVTGAIAIAAAPIASPMFAAAAFFDIRTMSEPISKLIPQEMPSEEELKVAAIEGPKKMIEMKKAEIIENREIRKKCNSWIFACKTEEEVKKEEEDRRAQVLAMKSERVQAESGIQKEYDIILNDTEAQLTKSLKTLADVRNKIVIAKELQTREKNEFDLTILEASATDIDELTKTHVLEEQKKSTELQMLNDKYTTLYVEVTHDRIAILDQQAANVDKIIKKLKGDTGYNKYVQSILTQAMNLQKPAGTTGTEVQVYQKPSSEAIVKASEMTVTQFTKMYATVIMKSSSDIRTKMETITKPIIGWETVKSQVIVEKNRLETSLKLRNVLLMAIPLLMKVMESAKSFTNYITDKVAPIYNKVNAYVSPIAGAARMAGNFNIAKGITENFASEAIGEKQTGGYCGYVGNNGQYGGAYERSVYYRPYKQF